MFIMSLFKARVYRYIYFLNNFLGVYILFWNHSGLLIRKYFTTQIYSLILRSIIWIIVEFLIHILSSDLDPYPFVESGFLSFRRIRIHILSSDQDPRPFVGSGSIFFSSDPESYSFVGSGSKFFRRCMIHIVSSDPDPYQKIDPGSSNSTEILWKSDNFFPQNKRFKNVLLEFLE